MLEGWQTPNLPLRSKVTNTGDTRPLLCTRCANRHNLGAFKKKGNGAATETVAWRNRKKTQLIGTKEKFCHRKLHLEMHSSLFHKYCLETKRHQGKKIQGDLLLKIQLLTESHLEQRPTYAVITTDIIIPAVIYHDTYQHPSLQNKNCIGWKQCFLLLS